MMMLLKIKNDDDINGYNEAGDDGNICSVNEQHWARLNPFRITLKLFR